MGIIFLENALEDGHKWVDMVPKDVSFEYLSAKCRAYLYLKDILIYELNGRGFDTSAFE